MLKNGESLENVIIWLRSNRLKVEKIEVQNIEVSQVLSYLQPVLPSLLSHYLKFDRALTKILLTKIW